MSRDYQLIPLDIRPAFDMDRIMALAGPGAAPVSDHDRLRSIWAARRDQLKAWRIRGNGESWLLAWLEPQAETDMEQAWAESPLEGYMQDMLNASLLMAAAESVIPELADHGCAPVPTPHPAIRAALGRLGLARDASGALDHRYALVTPMPFAGGCELCHLGMDCPRLRTVKTG